MIEIEKDCKNIREEIQDAKKYAMLALEYKEKNPESAALYNILAQQELNHMEMLHNNVVRLINNYRAEHGDPPAPMQSWYDLKHKEQIEDTLEVKVLMSMYAER